MTDNNEHYVGVLSVAVRDVSSNTPFKYDVVRVFDENYLNGKYKHKLFDAVFELFEEVQLIKSDTRRAEYGYKNETYEYRLRVDVMKLNN